MNSFKAGDVCIGTKYPNLLVCIIDAYTCVVLSSEYPNFVEGREYEYSNSLQHAFDDETALNNAPSQGALCCCPMLTLLRSGCECGGT